MKVNEVIFKSVDLIERAEGLRFDVPQLGERVTGFVVRFDGRPYAYLNQCAHVSIELDWQHGQFFNITKDLLICSTHGAQYEPKTGDCVLGPCKGKRLQAIKVAEVNNEVIINLESVGKQ
ncbi:MAG TPA: (2Fe-2S)-binding protein [Methylophilaceae bacterium]|nr:(2Fe-2S)-binding protein [Methylophilaceae bacterium]HAJ70732.1 (2Fe-2S)-binding protein [Methylophilaceae bacterium]